MSTQATQWALAQPGKTAEKLLLVVIANDANSAGVAFSGQERIARGVGIKRESVSRLLSDLERRGVIYRKERRRKNGSRTSDWIILAPNHEDRMGMYEGDPDELPAEIVDLTKASCAVRSRDPHQAGHVRQQGGPYMGEETSENPPSKEDPLDTQARTGPEVLRLHTSLWEATRYGKNQKAASAWIEEQLGWRDVLLWARQHRYWSGRAANILNVRREWAAIKAQFDSRHGDGRQAKRTARKLAGSEAVKRLMGGS